LSAREMTSVIKAYTFSAPLAILKGEFSLRGEDTNSDHEVTGRCHPHVSSHFQDHELIGVVRRLVFRNTIAGPPDIGRIAE